MNEKYAMEWQIVALVDHVERLVPALKKSEIEYFAYQMSERSGIGMVSLLTTLCEDLQNGVPFAYTAMGKSRSLALW